MAIHDVDKNNQDRSNPQPNVHGKVLPEAVMAHQTASSHYTTNETSSNNGYLQQRNRQIIANDGTTNKALFGYNSAISKWGLFVTDDGVDVTTNTDLSKFIFNSNQDAFKIVKIMDITVADLNWGSTGYYQTKSSSPHGLSFIPAVIAFVDGGNGGYQLLPAVTVGYNAGLYVGTISIYVDSTNVTIVSAMGNNGSATGTTTGFAAKVYLLQETAN